jgi:triphosphoribosyl-dephospho-CoA synthase
MTGLASSSPWSSESGSKPTAGRLAELACLLEVTARKPGNVHRFADLPGLHFMDFLLSAAAIAGPLDRAATDGVGAAVLGAVQATRRLVSTNTNLGMVLLLAPLAAVPEGVDLAGGVDSVLEETTIADACLVYRAIGLAQPGGMGKVPDQDLGREPTMTLRMVMSLAAGRDLIALQYTNGFREVLGEGLQALRSLQEAGQPLETCIVGAHLHLLASHPDSLIERKYGAARAAEVSRRARSVLAGGWPVEATGRRLCDEFDAWLRDPKNRLNPGTTADLVTAALYGALREGLICPPISEKFEGT